MDNGDLSATAISPTSPQPIMYAECFLFTNGVWFECITLATIYLHDFVVGQKLASLLHHRVFRRAENSLHERANDFVPISVLPFTTAISPLGCASALRR